MWDEAIVACCKVLFQHFPYGIEEHRDIYSIAGYEAGVVTAVT